MLTLILSVSDEHLTPVSCKTRVESVVECFIRAVAGAGPAVATAVATAVKKRYVTSGGVRISRGGLRANKTRTAGARTRGGGAGGTPA